MPFFQYKARSDTGKLLSGAIEAVSEQAVLQKIEEMGYTPISIQQERARGRKEGGGIFKRFEKVKAKDLVMLTRQMASLIKAGIPIMTVLQVLEKQTENKLMVKTLAQLQEDVSGGASFSEALSRHPGVFSDLYVNTVLAGETGGVLPEVLDRLATLLESELETRTAVKSAMRYPVIAVFVMVAAFFILTTLVVPQFAEIYRAVQLELPMPTQVLIALSDFINTYYYVIFPAILVLIMAFIRFKKTKYGHYQIDKYKLRVPIFGPLFIKLAMFRFSKMLATLEKSGVPILKIIEIIGKTVGNDIIAEQLASLRADVRDGKGISKSLIKLPLFPPLVTSMLAIGEETGRIDEMAEFIGYYYDQEIKYTIATLTDLIEPILTIVIAVGVLFFALAIFLPMWDLIQVIG